MDTRTFAMWKNGLIISMILGMLVIAAPVLADCADGGSIPNPIQYCDFPSLLCAVTTAVQRIGMLFAALAIVIIGFKFIQASASDNPSGIKEAKKYFFWVLIGTAILVGATVIAQAVINFLSTDGSATC